MFNFGNNEIVRKGSFQSLFLKVKKKNFFLGINSETIKSGHNTAPGWNWNWLRIATN